MGWETVIRKCSSCGHTQEELIDRKDRDVLLPCPDCSDVLRRQMLGNITRASYVDGTKRWSGVKEVRALERSVRKLKAAQRKGQDVGEEISRIKAEQKEIKKRGKTLTEIAPKVEG